MTAADRPTDASAASASEAPPTDPRGALRSLLAAVPLLIVVGLRYGVVGTLLRLSPVIVFGGVMLLMPGRVRTRPWAIWMFLIGAVGGSLVLVAVL